LQTSYINETDKNKLELIGNNIIYILFINIKL